MTKIKRVYCNVCVAGENDVNNDNLILSFYCSFLLFRWLLILCANLPTVTQAYNQCHQHGDSLNSTSHFDRKIIHSPLISHLFFLQIFIIFQFTFIKAQSTFSSNKNVNSTMQTFPELNDPILRSRHKMADRISAGKVRQCPTLLLNNHIWVGRYY